LAMNAWEHKTVTTGAMDQISVSLSGNGNTGLLFSSHWVGTGTATKIIGGGKIKVRSGNTAQLQAPDTNLPQTVQAPVQAQDLDSGDLAGGLQIFSMPNPFSGETTIVVELARPQAATLRVFDGTGRQVAELHNGMMDAGTHQFRFEASNLPAGFYYYTLAASGMVKTGKMLLAR